MGFMGFRRLRGFREFKEFWMFRRFVNFRRLRESGDRVGSRADMVAERDGAEDHSPSQS
jgi:hypothetical protein